MVIEIRIIQVGTTQLNDLKVYTNTYRILKLIRNLLFIKRCKVW
jgi:hypothetical protein